MQPPDEKHGLHRRIHEPASHKPSLVFPEKVDPPGNIDLFLWRGSAYLSVVQRIAAWVTGLFFVSAGVEFIMIAREDGEMPFGAIGIGAILLGAHTIRSGCRRHPRK
jgi:hypothetical protein